MPGTARSAVDTPRTPLSDVRRGDVLAQPVYHEGRTLYAPGRVLTDKDIQELKRLKVEAIAIRERDAKPVGDKVQTDPLNSEMRAQAIKTVRRVYEDFHNLDRQHGREIHSLGLRLCDEVKQATKLGIAVHDLRDHSNYTYQHSVNVTAISLAIGIRLGLTKEELNLLTVGGLLHDIGKMKIPPQILEKNGKLTNQEMMIVHKHPIWGWELLKECTDFDPVVWAIARQHHETLDGKGYPDKLMRWQIHELSKIVTVVDMWDALRSERPYKPAWHPDRTLAFINSPEMTGKLDPQVLEIFNQLIVPYPMGTRVMITGGRTGRVVGLNYSDYARPILKMDSGGSFMDMTEHKGMEVIETLELAA